MLISKPYGHTKKVTAKYRRTTQPSRKFVDWVQKSLSASDPIVTRICSDYANSGSDGTMVCTNATQAMQQIFRLQSGAGSTGAGPSFSSFANQFCAYFNLTTLAAATADRGIHFIDVESETRFTNMGNTTIDLDLWFVYPRADTPTAAANVSGGDQATPFVAAYETILAASFNGQNSAALTGVSGAVDVVPNSTMIGILPYDARLFCQHYRLGRRIRRQMLPGATWTMRHSIELNKDIYITDFFDMSAYTGTDGYIAMDMEDCTYGLLARIQCGHSSEYAVTEIIPAPGDVGEAQIVPDPQVAGQSQVTPVFPVFTATNGDVRQSSGKLAYKTVSRWRYHGVPSTGLNNPIVSVPPDTATQTALTTEALMPPFSGRVEPIMFS